MKTQLEILKDALNRQQQLLHVLTDRGPLIMVGAPMGVCVVVAMALRSVAAEPAPQSALVLSVLLGGAIAGILGMGLIWLGRKLANSQINSYQRAIGKLEPEQ